MTREEAIKTFEEILQLSPTLDETGCSVTEAMKVALSALRPVSREQVEKAWTAAWTVDEFGHKCSKCGEYLPDGEDVRKPQFCPECGRAMTDEAVEMVMERMEALHDNRT